MPVQGRALPQSQVLPLLQQQVPGTAVQRQYLQHLVGIGSANSEIHTDLAVQLVSWAASQMPPVNPRCAASWCKPAAADLLLHLSRDDVHGHEALCLGAP